MADKAKTKRERSANCSLDETNILVSLISDNKEIIECKNLNAITWRMKDKTWDIVTESFNSCSVTPRSKKALKTKYEDIKKNIQRQSAHNKIERFKTASGVPVMQNLTVTEKIISEMMGSTVDRQPSIWNSGTIPGEQNVLTIESDNMDDVDHENQEMQFEQNDLTQFDAFEKIAFLEDYGNLEEMGEKVRTMSTRIPLKWGFMF